MTLRKPSETYRKLPVALRKPSVNRAWNPVEKNFKKPPVTLRKSSKSRQ
jgi:hypothetical protein